jgi:hypothetical protein
LSKGAKMSKNELGEALMGQNRRDDRAMVERVIRRDRRFLHALMGLTVALWTLSAATVVTLYLLTMIYVAPIMQWAAQEQDLRRLMEVTLYFGLRIGWPMAIGSAVLAVLAAICTVFLVYWSRRTTLRLVDQRLEQILAELRHSQKGA